MKTYKKVLFITFFAYLIYGVFISQYGMSIFPDTLNRKNPAGFYDYVGVMNVHTSQSIGTGSFDQVVSAAQKTGLNFIFISDLNAFKVKKQLEKYYEKLLVFVDAEYSYLDSRLLIYGRSSYSDLNNFGQAQATISDLISKEKKSTADGIVVLAHPKKRGFRWSGPLPEGLDGIEIINLKSIWQQAWFKNKLSFIWSFLVYPFNPQLALLRLFPFPSEELQLWDQTLKHRKMLGFAGSDADGKLKFPKDSGIQLPSYETIFNIVRTHVLLTSELTGNVKNDQRKILNALNTGHFYFSLDQLANPKGFNALIRSAKGDFYSMGSSLPYEDNLQFVIRLAQKPLYPFDTIIYKDGKKIISTNSQETVFLIPGPGVYRIAIRVIPTFPLPDGKKWVPWIFTNPFYVN